MPQAGQHIKASDISELVGNIGGGGLFVVS